MPFVNFVFIDFSASNTHWNWLHLHAPYFHPNLQDHGFTVLFQVRFSPYQAIIDHEISIESHIALHEHFSLQWCFVNNSQQHAIMNLQNKYSGTIHLLSYPPCHKGPVTVAPIYQKYESMNRRQATQGSMMHELKFLNFFNHIRQCPWNTSNILRDNKVQVHLWTILFL